MQLVQAFVNSVSKCAPICFARLQHCILQARLVGVHADCNRALRLRKTRITHFACSCALGLLVHGNYKKMAADIMSLRHSTDISKSNGWRADYC